MNTKKLRGSGGPSLSYGSLSKQNHSDWVSLQDHMRIVKALAKAVELSEQGEEWIDDSEIIDTKDQKKNDKKNEDAEELPLRPEIRVDSLTEDWLKK